MVRRRGYKCGYKVYRHSVQVPPNAGTETVLDQNLMVHLDVVTLLVDDYDEGIEFFVGILGFELIEDSQAESESGHPKRWVVVRPACAQTGIVLALAHGPEQVATIGKQAGGRVGFFLRVDDFDEAYQRMISNGVRIVRPPRREPYGPVAVFLDYVGNHWDLLGPP